MDASVKARQLAGIIILRCIYFLKTANCTANIIDHPANVSMLVDLK